MTETADPSLEPGLRERSKARRRALLQRTAMRLFAERGYDSTTVADIAEAAELAPRTVSGYFPTKLELATSFADEIGGRLADTFAARPDADLLTVVDAWLTLEAEVMEPELAQLASAMYAANPGLRALDSGRIADVGQTAVHALAGELGVAVEHPMAQIVSEAFGATLAAYIQALSRSTDAAALHASVLTFLEGLVRSGRAAVR